MLYNPNSELTPTQELFFARERTRQPSHCLYLLVLLKTFQRLGYFAAITEVPDVIICHIAHHAGCTQDQKQLEIYDNSTARERHKALVRRFVGVHPFGNEARQIMIISCLKASSTRDDLQDTLTLQLKNWLDNAIKLPAFSTLLRCAKKCTQPC